MINPNPLISCRVRVGFTGRVKIAGPIRACLGLSLINRTFKLKIAFGKKNFIFTLLPKVFFGYF
jgi:hypothetical protein